MKTSKMIINTFLVIILVFFLWSIRDQYSVQNEIEIQNKVCVYHYFLRSAYVDFCNGERYFLDLYTDDLKEYIQVGDSLYKSKDSKVLSTVRYNGKLKEMKIWKPL